MIYNLFGKQLTGKQLTSELRHGSYIDKKNVDQLYTYLRSQQKVDAQKRMDNETDPDRKALMEEMFYNGVYNFDHYFGED